MTNRPPSGPIGTTSGTPHQLFTPSSRPRRHSPATAARAGTAEADPIPVFQNLRRVEPRNTPTMHSAAFNFDNFWDGRARFHFNGGSVFGAADPQNHIFIDQGNPGPNGGNLQGPTNRHIPPAPRLGNH